jgi:predicted neuraminidase
MTQIALLLLSMVGGDGLVSSEFVFEAAPFPSCHASTIAETPSGLVAAWFGGKHEKAPDVGIWLSRREAGKWTAPVEVADGQPPEGKRLPCWNPVLYQAEGGPLILFYKVGPDPETWWGLKKTSADGGKTWSAAERLPDGLLGPIKNKPVTLKDGSILAPSSTESARDEWRIHFERSADGGKTWTRTRDIASDPPINAIQPSVLIHPGDRLQAIGRTRSGHVFTVWSEDLGKTWGQMTLADLPNPNAGTDALTLADGRHLLVYNHSAIGRSPLNVAISDDGKTWKAALTLERDRGEYSYPAAIQTRDGLVHVTYTWNRKRIKHVTIDPKALILRDMPGGRWPD